MGGFESMLNLTIATIVRTGLFAGLAYGILIMQSIETNRALNHCRATSSDPVSCELRVYGR